MVAGPISTVPGSAAIGRLLPTSAALIDYPQCDTYMCDQVILTREQSNHHPSSSASHRAKVQGESDSVIDPKINWNLSEASGVHLSGYMDYCRNIDKIDRTMRGVRSFFPC